MTPRVSVLVPSYRRADRWRAACRRSTLNRIAPMKSWWVFARAMMQQWR